MIQGTAARDRKAWITLTLLVLVAIVSQIDRQIISVFMPQIGKELAIDHHQLGLIAGMSFAVFHLLAAFPIARLADRGDRPLIIAICLTIWSLSTAACAWAGNALQLVLIRIGLAAGEGGAGPAGQSLLLSSFPKERRTLVLSAMLAASAVGIGAGGAVGGFLSDWFDWRGAMIAVGLPGVVLAVLVWLLMDEPRRTGGATLDVPLQMPLGDVARVLFSTPSLRWIALTIICVATTGYPFLIWSSSFYQIVHGMSIKESGTALFIPITGGLVLGNLLAGWMGDRFGKGNPRYYARLACFGPLAGFPFGLLMIQAGSPMWSLAAFFMFHVLITMHLGPLQALAFAQVPVSMRAMTGAAINMIITICGIGIGTWLIGALSTWFSARYGDESLRYAMTTVSFSLPLAAITAIMAGRTARPLEEAH